MQKAPLLIAAFLTWIAGFVDAIGFISLGHIYTANMSGNSVSIGIQWAAQNWPEMVRRIWPVVAYVIGLLFCRGLVAFGARERIRSIASIAFVFEIAALLPPFFSHLTGREPLFGVTFAYVGLLAIAMGIQNAALTHFSSLTLHTGFVTGTLVKFAEEFTKYLTWSYDRLRSAHGSISGFISQSLKQPPLQVALLLAATWIAYVIGALCGALGDHTFHLRSLLVPVAALALLAAIDLYHPLAIREEQDQAKLSSAS